MPERRAARMRALVEQHGKQLIVLLLGLAATLLIIAVTAAAMTLGSITEATDRVEQTLLRQASINRLSTYNEQIENGRRGFIIQPDPAFIAVIRDATNDFDAELETLQTLLSGDYEGSTSVEQIAQLQAERVALIDETFADPGRIAREGVAVDQREALPGPALPDATTDPDADDNALGDDAGPEIDEPLTDAEIALPRARVPAARNENFDAEEGVMILRAIRDIFEQLAVDQEEELSLRNRSQLDTLVQFYVVGGLALFLLLAMMGTAIVLILRYNRDLTAAQTGLRRANETLESTVSARTAELTRANAEIQRFAYIVSHDLRSPLVNVLGFTSELDEARKVIHRFITDLFEQNPDIRDEDVRLAVEEDLPEALRFIRTSTEKMDRLINSILELSRQGRRTLRPEKLDMEELVDTIVASLQQTIEDSGAEVTINRIPDLTSDRIAVEQLLQNLIENALKYLSPKRAGEITVEGKRSAGMVQIDVIDNGRGIAPADHERIFDLFRRAGTQDQKGEGIGLANVRALAYRLGGTVDVESDLDQGARFRLSLPTEFIVQDTPA